MMSFLHITIDIRDYVNVVSNIYDITFSSPVHDSDISCQQILFFKTYNVDIMITSNLIISHA